ncbi:MAG: hypothetical protein H0W88_06355 [Parachlamydiaceae bacterium]|nr:hypothetical protein [Parachlamydiaceae bacterium]
MQKTLKLGAISMLSVSNQSLSNKIIPTIQSKWINISPTQKKVIFVVLAIFAALTLTKMFYYIFRVKKCADDSNKETTQVFQETLKVGTTALPVAPQDSINTQPEQLPSTLPSNNLEINTNTSVEPVVVDLKDNLEQQEPIDALEQQKPLERELKEKTLQESNSKIEVPAKEAPKVLVKETTLPDGTIVEGKLVDGLLEGPGKMKTVAGTVHEGLFQKGLLHGQGKSILNGVLSEGPFVCGELHGKGKITHIASNAIIAEGMFIKGELIEGTAIKEGVTYKGIFYNGFLVGYGSKVTPEEDVFEGNFKEGKLFGSGKITKKDKTVIEGIFKDDVRIVLDKNMDLGNNIPITEDSEDYYAGEFKNHKRNGIGRSDENGSIIEGLFNNDSLVEGTWRTRGGSIFIGNFKSDVLNGNGLKIEAGIRYEGMFLKDKLHGQARIIYANGDMHEGIFEKNEIKQGSGKITTLAGVVSVV